VFSGLFHAQTSEELLLAALLYFVFLGGMAIPGSFSFQCTQDLGGAESSL
jgi:hypothetical protein